MGEYSQCTGPQALYVISNYWISILFNATENANRKLQCNWQIYAPVIPKQMLVRVVEYVMER